MSPETRHFKEREQLPTQTCIMTSPEAVAGLLAAPVSAGSLMAPSFPGTSGHHVPSKTRAPLTDLTTRQVMELVLDLSCAHMPAACPAALLTLRGCGSGSKAGVDRLTASHCHTV
jgi:hypothetical protein